MHPSGCNSNRPTSSFVALQQMISAFTKQAVRWWHNIPCVKKEVVLFYFISSYAHTMSSFDGFREEEEEHKLSKIFER